MASFRNDYLNETVPPNLSTYLVLKVETCTGKSDTVILHLGNNYVEKDRFREMADKLFFSTPYTNSIACFKRCNFKINFQNKQWRGGFDNTQCE